MASPDSKSPLTIFHTNDFHNRLTTAGVAKITHLYAQAAQPKLLLDAGDAGGSPNITFKFGGEPILDQMSQLGYSAMTVGNRDFHVSRIGFRAKLFRARFPVLCANIRPSNLASTISATDDEHPLARSGSWDDPDVWSYIVRDVGDWRVLIVGLTVPMVTERMWERKLSAYIFDPPVRTAARILPLLRNRIQPDFTIALTHIGLRLDREIAESVFGIDLIIGGHSHELLPEGERVGGTLIVQAGSHGRYIGVVEICPGANRPDPLRLSARCEPI